MRDCKSDIWALLSWVLSSMNCYTMVVASDCDFIYTQTTVGHCLVGFFLLLLLSSLAGGFNPTWKDACSCVDGVWMPNAEASVYALETKSLPHKQTSIYIYLEVVNILLLHIGCVWNCLHSVSSLISRRTLIWIVVVLASFNGSMGFPNILVFPSILLNNLSVRGLTCENK